MSHPVAKTLDRHAVPWLFVTALVSTIPHVLHQPAWLSGLSTLVLLLASGLWWRNANPLRHWQLALLVVIASAGIYGEYRTLFGRDAGVGMLLIFMCLKLLELKGRRDAIVVVTLGYFLLLTHYFYSQSILTGLWLLAAVVIVTATLIRIHGGPASTPPATLRYATLLTIQAAPFMIVLYLLFPRINGPLWGMPQDAHAGMTGLSEQMTVGDIANLALNGEIAFRVRFDGQVPDRQKLYWRGPVMEFFDGRTWRPQPGPRAPATIELLTPPLAYETTLEASSQRWLLGLDAPGPLPAELALDGTLTVSSRQTISQRQRFRLSASPDYRFNVHEDPRILQRNLALPPGRNPQSLALAATWRNAPSKQIVQKALALFSGKEFAYTLQPPLLGEHSIDDFLFQTRRGFCEHYAAAFVVLMRGAGVPARVVGGYQGGEQNPVDGYLVVRQSDAHAWAEVWQENEGWVRVDPTFVVAPARLDTGIASALPAGEPLPERLQVRAEWLRNLHYRWEALNNAWNQQVLGYNLDRQRELVSRLGLADTDWQSMVSLLGAACFALLLIFSGWTLAHRESHDPAQRLWRKAIHRLNRRKVNCPPWETPLALVKRLEEERPELAEPLRGVALAYLAARYGRQPGDLKKLRAAIAHLP